MGFLTDRKGNFSWFRLSLLVMVLGGLFVGFGVISFQIDQQSRRTPFFPDLPPNATQWGGTEFVSVGFQRNYYRVPGGNVEEVAAFYQGQMERFYGTGSGGSSSLERCQRLPPVGEFTNIPDVQRPANDGKIYDPNFVPGRDLPFLFKCMFDRSGFNATQDTLVWIQPGTRNADPNLNTEGDVVIIYEQRWQN
ncbi:MAG: hypothetical protein SNJ54_12915 [Anaerolineae bacterium]